MCLQYTTSKEEYEFRLVYSLARYINLYDRIILVGLYLQSVI